MVKTALDGIGGVVIALSKVVNADYRYLKSVFKVGFMQSLNPTNTRVFIQGPQKQRGPHEGRNHRGFNPTPHPPIEINGVQRRPGIAMYRYHAASILVMFLVSMSITDANNRFASRNQTILFFQPRFGNIDTDGINSR